MATRKSSGAGRPRKLPSGMWLRGRTYYAKFKKHGREVRKRLSTDYRVACELLNDLKARADRADFGILDNDYTWAELKAEFMKWARQSVRCWQEYGTDLAWFETYSSVRKVSQLSEAYIVGFREWRLSHGVTPRTVNKHVVTLKNMLNKGVEWQRIASNPIAKVEPLEHDCKTKERRSLTVEEVEAIFAASPPHLAPVWRMFMCTGIRKGELINMRFEDVDFDYRTVTVHAGTAKNHRAREIPLDDDILDMIAKLKEQAVERRPVKGWTEKMTTQQRERFSQDHVFVTKANTPLRNNLLPRFYAVCKKAGIEGAHPGGSIDIHSLRVSFTTLSIEHGAKPKAIQEILGHSTLDLTMRIYTKATDRSKRDAITALPFAKVSQPKHVVSISDAAGVQNGVQVSEVTIKPLKTKCKIG